MSKKSKPAPPITEEQRQQVLNNPAWKEQYDRMLQYSIRVAEEYLKVCWKIYCSSATNSKGGYKHCPEMRRSVAVNPDQKALITIKKAIDALGGSANRTQIYEYFAQLNTPMGKTKIQSHLHYLEENKEISKHGKRGNWTYSISLDRHGDVHKGSAAAA